MAAESIVVAALAAKTLAYWYWSLRLRPGTPLDVLLMFLPGGDTDYFGQVVALSHLKFGETVVKEFAGTGLRSFPFASILIHSVLFRAAGVVGFVSAGILFHILFFYALLRFLTRCGVVLEIGRIVSLTITMELPVALLRPFSPGIAEAFGLHFWSTRFPRPLVTEVLVLLFIGTAVLLVSGNQERLRRQWLVAGLSLGLLAQSDIHQLMNMGLIVLVIVVWLTIESATPRRVLIGNIASMAAIAILLMVPFFIQRLEENSDIPRRYGLFPVSRNRLIWMPGTARMLLGIALAGVILGVVFKLKAYFRLDDWAINVRGIWMILVLCVIAILCCPVSLIVLGRGIQIYQFGDRAMLINGYALAMALGLLGSIVALRIRRYFKVLTAATLAIVACTGVVNASIGGRYRALDEWPTSDAIRMDDFAGSLSHYKSAFIGLTHELENNRYRGLDVLATLDHQVGNWWEFKQKYLFLADPFNSTVSDGVIEERFIAFASILQLDAAGFGELMDQPYMLWRLSSDKYQASKAYTFGRIDDYLPAKQDLIHRSSVFDNWQVALPRSEHDRLLREFNSYLSSPLKPADPQLIVLVKDKRRELFNPPLDKWERTYQNERFEIWKHR